MRPVPILAALALAACTVAPPPDGAQRAASCREAFQRYDRALLFDWDAMSFAGGSQMRAGSNLASSRAAAEGAILQYDCLTFPDDLPDLAAIDGEPYRLRPADNAAPPRYLHLGIVTTNATEARLRAAWQALGYPVRVKGAEKLGRRVFIGPLSTEPAQARALELARLQGFEAAYFLNRVP